MIIPIRKQELFEKLNLVEKETEHWQHVLSRMTIPFHNDGIISQFTGYEKLKEFDWEGYIKKYGNIERLDRVLKAEGDSPDRYKVSKQADVLMLFYLFSHSQLRRLFKLMGYPYSQSLVRKNVEYYVKRTSHGSTLSKVVYTRILDTIARDAARNFFQEVLLSDVCDIQGGTTPEGIHLGAMSGSIDIVMRGFAGVHIANNMLCFKPLLPTDVKRLDLQLQFHGQWFRITIDQKYFSLQLESGGVQEMHVKVYGQPHKVTFKKALKLRLKKTA